MVRTLLQSWQASPLVGDTFSFPAAGHDPVILSRVLSDDRLLYSTACPAVSASGSKMCFALDYREVFLLRLL